MKLRVELCPACYKAIERAPLLHVRRIMLACPTCRPAALELQKPKFRNVLELSALTEATKHAAQANQTSDAQRAARDLLNFYTRNRRQRGR